MAIGNCILGLLILFCSFQTILSQSAIACAGVPNGSFVRNSRSCRAYYYCSDGEAHPSECSENYLFEPVQQMCQTSSYVQCTGCSPFGVQHIAHPTDCSSYYLCVAGIRTLQKCGANLIFDQSIGDCNAASSVQCVLDYTQICAEFAGYVKIGDPNDCSKYYSCLYGEAYHQSCAPGLFFKPAISTCTFPEETDFCEGNSSAGLSSDDKSGEPNVLASDNSDVVPKDVPSDNNGHPNDDTIDVPIDLPSDNSSDEFIHLPSDNSNEESLDQHSENIADNVHDQPSDNISEEHVDFPSDNNIDGAIESDTDNNSDEHIDLPSDDNTDDIIDLHIDNYSDESVVQASDNFSNETH